MPQSNKMAVKRQQKANVAAGVGDENGRMVRQKDAPKMSKCALCQHEMRVTKTNTELTAHSTSKHAKSLEDCFPGATALQNELIAVANGGGAKAAPQGPTKAQKKAAAAADLDALLNAGVAGSKKK